MTGVIAEIRRDHGTGTVLGADGKRYMFHRRDLRDIWFHELVGGATVAFEPGKDLLASRVGPQRRPTISWSSSDQHDAARTDRCECGRRGFAHLRRRSRAWVTTQSPS
jgi:hypothetical protein